MVRERRRQELPQTGYTIRIEMFEREDESLRAVFNVNMPDSRSPKTEFWMITFRCDLAHFERDMQSVRQISGDFNRIKVYDLKYDEMSTYTYFR